MFVPYLDSYNNYVALVVLLLAARFCRIIKKFFVVFLIVLDTYTDLFLSEFCYTVHVITKLKPIFKGSGGYKFLSPLIILHKL